jgi:hypothetical protein
MVHAAGESSPLVALALLPVPFVLLVWAWRFVGRLSRRALEGDDAAFGPFGG